MKKIYLAGHSIETEYRQYCIDNYSTDFEMINPMTRTFDVYDEEAIKKHDKSKDKMMIPDNDMTNIIHGDKHDIRRSDIVLAYIKKPTFGTVMEVMYAYDHGTPVITVNPDLNWAGDIWLRFHSEAIFKTLDEAFKYLKSRK
jgi:nucleoside 2-deoxyribosyltransferase